MIIKHLHRPLSQWSTAIRVQLEEEEALSLLTQTKSSLKQDVHGLNRNTHDDTGTCSLKPDVCGLKQDVGGFNHNLQDNPGTFSLKQDGRSLKQDNVPAPEKTADKTGISSHEAVLTQLILDIHEMH